MEQPIGARSAFTNEPQPSTVIKKTEFLIEHIYEASRSTQNHVARGLTYHAIWRYTNDKWRRERTIDRSLRERENSFHKFNGHFRKCHFYVNLGKGCNCEFLFLFHLFPPAQPTVLAHNKHTHTQLDFVSFIHIFIGLKHPCTIARLACTQTRIAAQQYGLSLWFFW